VPPIPATPCTATPQGVARRMTASPPPQGALGKTPWRGRNIIPPAPCPQPHNTQVLVQGYTSQSWNGTAWVPTPTSPPPPPPTTQPSARALTAAGGVPGVTSSSSSSRSGGLAVVDNGGYSSSSHGGSKEWASAHVRSLAQAGGSTSPAQLATLVTQLLVQMRNEGSVAESRNPGMWGLGPIGRRPHHHAVLCWGKCLKLLLDWDKYEDICT
jgi:hypothetical protein